MEPLRFIPVMDPDGASQVEALAREIWPPHYTPIIGEEQVDYMLAKLQSAQAILAQIGEGQRYFLLQIGDHSLGYLAFQPQDGMLYLSKLYLLPKERGKGAAYQALEFLKTRARTSGLKTIFLRVHKRNPSVAIYEKLGFRITGPLVTQIGEGFIMDDYRMELALS